MSNFVAEEEKEKRATVWFFLTTLPGCNLRIPADVHNTSLALVAMETLSGKLQRQTERKCADGVEQQTEQGR